jgi:hypothetical protein
VTHFKIQLIKILYAMITPDDITFLTYSSPVHIQIEVKGALDKKLSDYLGGLKIEWRTDRNKTKISRLEGEITDQASLMGVLNALYNMRFPLINVMVKH